MTSSIGFGRVLTPVLLWGALFASESQAASPQDPAQTPRPGGPGTTRTAAVTRTADPVSIDGVLDELRLSPQLRSAAWIKACYLNGVGQLVGYRREVLLSAD